MSDIETIVKNVIIDKLFVDENEVTNQASFSYIGADSLDTVELIMEFEKTFGIAIPDEEAEKISTVGEIISYIEKIPEIKNIDLLKIIEEQEEQIAYNKQKKLNDSYNPPRNFKIYMIFSFIFLCIGIIFLGPFLGDIFDHWYGVLGFLLCLIIVPFLLWGLGALIWRDEF